MWNRFWLDASGFFLGAMLAFMWVDSHAATSIFVCGTSTYTCASGSEVAAQALNDPVGGVTITESTEAVSVQVPIGTNSKGQCPAGWTNCGPGQVPAPPASIPWVQKWSGGSAGLFDTLAAVGAGWDVYRSANDFNYHWSVTSCVEDVPGVQGHCNSDKFWDSDNSFVNNTSTTFVTVHTCPAGYTVGASNCTLNNASLVMKPSDGKCGIVRTGNSYSADPKDPDCTGPTSAATKLNLSIGSGTVTAGNGDATVKVQANSSDGTASVKSDTPSGGNTTVRQIAVGPQTGEAGPTLGTSTSTVQGVATGTLASELEPKEPCGLPGTPPCKIDETGTPIDPGSMAAALSEWNTAKAARETALNDLGGAGKKTDLGLTFGITWPSTACVDPSFSIAGHVLTVPLCEKRADVNAIMGWLMYVLTAFYLFSLIREIS